MGYLKMALGKGQNGFSVRKRQLEKKQLLAAARAWLRGEEEQFCSDSHPWIKLSQTSTKT